MTLKSIVVVIFALVTTLSVVTREVLTLSNGKYSQTKYLSNPKNSNELPTTTQSSLPECPVGSKITQYVETKILLDGCICPAYVLAVCGTDGVTYSNECLLDCAHKKNPCVKLKCNDECGLCAPKEPSKCSTTKNNEHPICASDCVTYNNTCLFNDALKNDSCLKINCNTTCASCDLCKPCNCAGIATKPICASDGVRRLTYNNTCQLNCAKRKNMSLHKVYDGHCKDDCICPEGFDKSDPICAVDDKKTYTTYANPCILACEARNNRNLKAVCKGACQSGES